MKNIVKPHARVNQKLIDKFLEMKNVYSLSAVLSDAQERDNVMRHTIKQRTVNKRIIGPALTVKLTPGDIVDCLVIFEIAQRGDIVVIDAFSESETSIWGGSDVWIKYSCRYCRCGYRWKCKGYRRSKNA